MSTLNAEIKMFNFGNKEYLYLDHNVFSVDTMANVGCQGRREFESITKVAAKTYLLCSINEYGKRYRILFENNTSNRIRLPKVLRSKSHDVRVIPSSQKLYIISRDKLYEYVGLKHWNTIELPTEMRNLFFNKIYAYGDQIIFDTIIDRSDKVFIFDTSKKIITNVETLTKENMMIKTVFELGGKLYILQALHDILTNAFVVNVLSNGRWKTLINKNDSELLNILHNEREMLIVNTKGELFTLGKSNNLKKMFSPPDGFLIKSMAINSSNDYFYELFNRIVQCDKSTCEAKLSLESF